MNAKIGLIHLAVTWIFNCLHLIYLHMFQTGMFATVKHKVTHLRLIPASQSLISHAPFRVKLTIYGERDFLLRRSNAGHHRTAHILPSILLPDGFQCQDVLIA